MRRVLLLLAFVLVPVLAGAQSLGGGFIQYYAPSGGGTWDGGEFSSAALGPTSCTSPAYSYTADSNAGACLQAANEVRLVAGPQDAEGGYFRAAWGVGTLAQMVYLDGSSNATTISVGDNAITTQADGVSTGTFTSTRAFAGIRSGTAAPSATDCDAAAEAIPPTFYLQTGDPATVNLQLFRCTQTGPASYAWHPVAYQLGTTAPATCTVGAVFFDSDATAGSNWFGCTSANTWTVLGGGIGDPGANGIMVRTAANTSTNRTLQAGTGVTVSNGSGVAGDPTVAADQAVVVFKGSGTDDPPAACGDTGDAFQLLDFYLETDTNEIYQCRAVDTWVLTAHVADDSVLVGSGTALVVEAIPDCDDTGGNHLNYNTTGSAGSRFSCGTSGGSAAFDPSTTVDIMEEFIAGSGNSDGTIGTHGWRSEELSSGTTETATIVGNTVDHHPGMQFLKSHATNDNSGVLLTLTSGFVQDMFTANDVEWSLDVLVRPQSVTSVQFVVGLFDNYDRADRTNNEGGVWARFDTDASDATWIFQMCNASGAAGCGDSTDDTNTKVVASTVSPSAETWYRVRISRDATGVGGNPTYYFQINDETAKTFCASGCDDTLIESTTNLLPGILFLTRTTTGVQDFIVDYFRYQQTGMSRY